MKILITYKSKTGFTKDYAEMISKKIDCTVKDFNNTSSEDMSDYDVVVFGSRLHAGRVDGFEKAKEMFTKSNAKKLFVFVTGATPLEAKEAIDEVWNKNLTAEEMSNIPHFYMPSGLRYEKMNLTDKAMMKLAAVMMKNKKEKSDFEQGFEQAISSSYDISSEEYIFPLVEALTDYSEEAE